jgi:hypothetical protein
VYPANLWQDTDHPDLPAETPEIRTKYPLQFSSPLPHTPLAFYYIIAIIAQKPITASPFPQL